MRHPRPHLVRTTSRLLALGLAATLVGAAASAQHAPPSFEAPLRYDSGPVENLGVQRAVVISRTVAVEDAEWLRLTFRSVTLAGDPDQGTGSILRITSHEDGHVQEMNARHVAEWRNTSAYFNGDTVQVDIEASPGTGTNRLVLAAATAGAPDLDKSQCGSQDDRVASSDPRNARVLPVGCTAWLMDDCQHCFGSAGHCMGSSFSVVQFNVPLSDSNGSKNNPPPSDQYAVDVTSKQSTYTGIGNDWGYFGVFDNSTTGLSAFEAQGAAYTLVTPPAFNGSQSIRITGYGTDSGSANQTQQTHTGPWISAAGTYLEYQVDTTGGNSGSPVVHEPTGNVIGVHTNAGCNTGTGAGNTGTGFDNGSWQSVVAAPKGVCKPIPPTTFCTAKLNSQFCLPTISATGTPSLSGGVGSFLIDSGLQMPLVNGFLLYGYAADSIPFQGGFLCIAPPTVRTGVQFSGGSTGNPCSGSFTFDFGAYLASGADANLTCGTEVYSQYWSRDTGFTAPNNTNLSLGLEFTIVD